MKEVLGQLRTTLCPATQIYNMLLSPYWTQIEDADIESWRCKTVASISMCRLLESVMKTLFPLLLENPSRPAHGFHGWFKFCETIRVFKKIRGIHEGGAGFGEAAAGVQEIGGNAAVRIVNGA